MIRIALQLMAIVLVALGLWKMAPRVERALHVAPLPGRSPGATGSAAAPAPTLPEFAPPPLERFADLLRAPIFFSSRRMPRSSASTTPTEEQRRILPTVAQLRLQGVMIHKGRRRALLHVQGKAPKWYEQGETIIGWRITRIGEGFVVLHKDGREARVSLYQ